MAEDDDPTLDRPLHELIGTEKPLATVRAGAYRDSTHMTLLAGVLISVAVIVVALAFVVRRRRADRIDLGGVSDQWLMSHRMES